MGPIIEELFPSPLGSIAGHQDSAGVNRFAPKAFPIHLAAHRVDSPASRSYCEEHAHEGDREINLFLPDTTGLRYSASVGGREHLIEKPTALWIPPKVLHSANALAGAGWFVCLRY